MVVNERPAPPAEGSLITAALKSSKLSAREAARRAGISEGRWRQISQGFQTVSRQHVPVRGPADTVARMAQVVGVTPEQLDEVGRADAAEELRALPSPPEPEMDLTLPQAKRMLDELYERVRRLEGEHRETGS